MKYVVLALIFLIGSSTVRAANIPWSNSFEASISYAKKVHKPLMVFVKVEWSQWCKKLERETLSSNTVSNLAKSFVPVKLDGDHEGRSFARRYEVKGYPEILFLDSNGLVIGRCPGLPTSADLLEKMKLALTNLKAFPGLIDRIQRDPKDLEALSLLVQIYVDRRDFRSATTMLERCVRADLANRKGFNGIAYLALASGYQSAMQFDEALDLFQKAGAIESNKDRLLVGKWGAINCLVALGRNAEAIEQLQQYLATPNLTANKVEAQNLLEQLKTKEKS